MTIAFINGKGGSGKSTCTVLIALALQSSGKKVAIQDLDPQRTASRWLLESQESIPINSEFDSADFVLIDTPPRLDSAIFKRVLSGADKLILPTAPSPADLFGSQDTVQALKEAGKLSNCHVLFTNVQEGTILAREARETGSKCLGLPILNSHLRRRQVYQHSFVLGWNGLPIEAQKELLQAACEIGTLLVKHVPSPDIVSI